VNVSALCGWRQLSYLAMHEEGDVAWAGDRQLEDQAREVLGNLRAKLYAQDQALAGLEASLRGAVPARGWEGLSVKLHETALVLSLLAHATEALSRSLCLTTA
jgi:hypothetical protein